MLKHLIVLSTALLLSAACSKTELNAKKISDNTKVEESTESNFIGTPVVSTNSPCHLSQTSLVSYDLQEKSFLVCNGKKWNKIPQNSKMSNLTPTEGGYMLVDHDKIKEEAKMETISEAIVQAPKPSKYNGPRAFKCRAAENTNSFRCKSSASGLQLAH